MINARNANALNSGEAERKKKIRKNKKTQQALEAKLFFLLLFVIFSPGWMAGGTW